MEKALKAPLLQLEPLQWCFTLFLKFVESKELKSHYCPSTDFYVFNGAIIWNKVRFAVQQLDCGQYCLRVQEEEGSFKLLPFCSNAQVMTTCFCLVPDCSGSNQRCPQPRIFTLTVTDKRLLGKMCCQHINSRLSFLNALKKSEPNLFSSSAYNAISAWNVPSTSIESKSYPVFQRHPPSDFAGDSNRYKVNPCIKNYDTKAKKSPLIEVQFTWSLGTTTL